jgi:hypothetical protein
MKKYHKIQSLFKRDRETKKIIIGDYSLPEFKYLERCKWTFTEKVDGTNIRIMFDGTHITFGGKTDNAQIPAPLVAELEQRFLPQLETFKKVFPNGVCLYGEGYGPKIQNGGKYRSDQAFVLFDIKIGEQWLLRSAVEDIALTLNVDVVPIIGNGSLYDLVSRVRTGIKSKWGNFEAEGIVARPEIELRTRSGERIITKLKTRDFKK